MSISLTPIPITARATLEAMLISYFKEIDPTKIQQVATGEQLDYPYLDQYWTDKNRFAFFILNKTNIVGFSLLNDHIICKSFLAQRAVAEFYIKKKYRNLGIGKRAALLLFQQFPGKWEVKQASDNPSAIQFWRNTIQTITRNDFIEKQLSYDGEKAVIQLFTIS
ncbi:MAG: GNAT family N-acetyltransferase [Saprospiraceae bacterium]